MSKHFAIVENSLVVDCIIADNQESADTIKTDTQTCIEYVPVVIGTKYINNEFRSN